MASPRIKIPASVRALRLEAKKYYKLVYTQIAQGKESQDIDEHAITILCIEYAKYLDATEAISEDGIIILNARQDKVPHPGIAIQKSSLNSIKQIWNSLGATPEARRKVSSGSESSSKKKKPKAGVATVKN